MRNVLKSLLAAAALPAVFATPIHAADLGPYGARSAWTSQPAAPAPFSWSGFYFGVQAGYGWGTTDAASNALPPGVQQSFSYDLTGAVGGVHAGFNWQANRLVFGLETDFEGSRITGSSTGVLGLAHQTDIDWMGSLRGRVGYAAGNTLFYATGGLAYGDVAITTPLIAASEWRTGWTLGGGIEHAFTPNLTARVEYRYTDLGSVTYATPLAGVNDSSSVTHSAVRAGFSYKF
jgi:outer membrane immunogenic protein